MRIFATGFSDGFDGPGRRWIVYLKGCNMRCRWCANPESLSFDRQVMYYPARKRPLPGVCPYDAISADGKLDRTKCEHCNDFTCITLYKHKALELAGRDVSPRWVLDEALSARPLLGETGGVTFGGGEPTLQRDELLEAISLLKRGDIHTAMETNASNKDFDKFTAEVDWLICDLKCVSPAVHKLWTSCDNALILENIRTAASVRSQLTVRIPFVAGFNDSADEIRRIAEYLSGLGCDGMKVEVLRMHHIGRCKYEALGMEYPAEGIPEPAADAAENFVNELSCAGLRARLA